MEVKSITPPINGFLEVKLDKLIIDYLWKIIDIANTNNENFKDRLVGNISQSLALNDIDSFFYKSVCVPLAKHYREVNPYRRDPVIQKSSLDSKREMLLNQFWVNYQYQTEFNPYHDHSGIYSFAIWLKIPYHYKDQIKLNQFNGMKKDSIKAGNFEFEYMDTLGTITNLEYKLSPSLEGTMVFFPAKLRHCVYPFYEVEEPRISIAGNISYLS